jgi:hypothetical protein
LPFQIFFLPLELLTPGPLSLRDHRGPPSHCLFVTTHVVRLKLYRLKAEESEQRDCGALAEKKEILASNMDSKCAVFPFFNSLQPSAYPAE